ncbi:hypothetical protein [Azospirillum agricola]|uniref:hypothetical protein n=1 Tax=Azospirillum agricola TaxID=1720247 RepID=UPI000A0F1088|nr:hypothetical protein [Azospirillum agricola]MBP2231482.1 hypothetical protein [Azospirillum agricola]SMH44277.1 hypothetical protein SAMN02982994_2067 [Azospirillum lipoferum]
MNVEPDVLAFATSLLQVASDAERANGWEPGDLLRTTLRLLAVAGADRHDWAADELADEVRDLVEALQLRNAHALSGAFDCHGMAAAH